jgi:hypothetical protein
MQGDRLSSPSEPCQCPRILNTLLEFNKYLILWSMDVRECVEWEWFSLWNVMSVSYVQNLQTTVKTLFFPMSDHFYGLVVRVPGYRSRGLDSIPWHYQIFWDVAGLEWSPLSLVSRIEDLLGRKSSGSGLESGEYGRRYLSHWPRGTVYLQKLVLTSLTSGGHSASIVFLRTQAMECSLV